MPGAPLITGAILAGGFSRRLGQDKASLELGGRPLALWVAAVLAPRVSDCWLVTNHPERHLTFGLPLLTDLRPFQGPVGGLVTALFYSRTPWVMVAAVDNPFLAPRLVTALATRAAGTSRPAVVCRSPSGLEPFPGLYATRLLPRLEEFLQADRRPTRFLEICHPLILPEPAVKLLDPDSRSFFNLNTPQELQQATLWLQGRSNWPPPGSPSP